jgi:hypothetical protein
MCHAVGMCGARLSDPGMVATTPIRRILLHFSVHSEGALALGLRVDSDIGALSRSGSAPGPAFPPSKF